MIKKRHLLILQFVLLLHQSTLIGQDLQKATTSYFLNSHFHNDSELIKNSHIKCIEKNLYRYDNDSLISTYLEEKYQYNNWGKPYYVYSHKQGIDKSEMKFYYDSIGNMIKQEIFSYSKSSIKYQANEIFEWAYDTAGRLARQRRFMIIDNIPVEKGAHYFPEKLFIFSNDTILYDHINKSAKIISDDAQHCRDSKVEMYPPSFKNSSITTLTFHPNNQLKHKSVSVNSLHTETDYDECGNNVKLKPSVQKCSNNFFNMVECPTPEMENICNHGDTVTLNHTLVFQHKSTSMHSQIDSRGEWTIITEQTAYYNKNFKMVRSIIVTNRETVDAQLPYYAMNNYHKNDFTYYDNGLLHEIKTENKNGSLIERIEYSLQYFE